MNCQPKSTECNCGTACDCGPDCSCGVVTTSCDCGQILGRGAKSQCSCEREYAPSYQGAW